MLPIVRQHGPICIDIGTKFCPCSLAEAGECLTCSILRGEALCDCEWRGVCVYNEYLFNRQKAKETRREHAVNILAKIPISPRVVKLVVEAPEDFEQEWAEPGSFVMARATNTTNFYSVPLCIFRVVEQEPRLLELVVQENGIKTKALLGSTSTIRVRGPYYNGWFGYKQTKSVTGSQVIMAVRGIGQAPALKMAERLIGAKNEVLVYLDPGSVEKAFIYKQLVEMGAYVKQVNLMNEAVYREVEQILAGQDVKLVVSAGADAQHTRLAEVIERSDSPAAIVLTNNHSMTCGEGICGACMVDWQPGEKVKTCKSQLLGEQIIQKINHKRLTTR